VHAHEIAKALKMEGYICPAGAGVASALGFLTAPASFEFARTFFAKLSPDRLGELDGVFDELESEGRATLSQAGIQDTDMRFTRQADLRHVGQGHEIVVTLPDARLAEVDLDGELRPRFYEAYEAIYGHAHRHLGLEITTCRLTASGPRPQVRLQEIEARGGEASEAIKGYRDAFFAEVGGFFKTPLYERSKLAVGMRFEGPAIVEEVDSTAVIGPNTSVTIDRYANLIVELHA
jgi:N-methylhydantoinase A/oxoprolinase/acetone carboxylase beta subunit